MGVVYIFLRRFPLWNAKFVTHRCYLVMLTTSTTSSWLLYIGTSISNAHLLLFITSSCSLLPPSLLQSPLPCSSSSRSTTTTATMVVARLAWALVCAMAMAAVLCTPAAGDAAGAPPRKAAASPATTGPPTDLSECTTVIYDMTDCLDYVSPFSNVSMPTATCCGGIKEVVRVNPWCLCDALKEGDDMDVQVNMSRAVELPTACKIPVPDLHNCSSAF